MPAGKLAQRFISITPEGGEAPSCVLPAENQRKIGIILERREVVVFERREVVAMSEAKGYVRVDEHGVMRVGDSRVMLDSVVAAFKEGHSPETIRQQYPALTLEAVYGAITYYLAHQAEIEAYLQRQAQVWEQARAKSEETPSPVVERLRGPAVKGVPEVS
jgi:uncharacterized protein (DUF433 family)